MAKEFIKIKRAECLPASVQEQLGDRGILGGLVEVRIQENSPKEIIEIVPATHLFSQKLEETM